MNELALFTGAGGGLLASILLGHRPVCAVEIDPYCRQILLARQRDGCLPPFPIWDDVRTFDGRPWRGSVDIVSGGFPCQDISSAGKGAGIDGPNSSLWFQMARIVREVQPRIVFVENSPVLTARGFGSVLGDLAAMGFNARWGVYSAADVGAPHLRKRIWIYGYTNSESKPGLPVDGEAPRLPQVADADSTRREEQRGTVSTSPKHHAAKRLGWWETEPPVGRVVNGVAHRVDRLRALGNGQVPGVARLAFNELTPRRSDRAP